METAILLGIPSPYVARLRNALDSQGGLPEAWSLLFVPAPKKNPEINRGTVRQACHFADKHQSPHIFGVFHATTSLRVGDRDFAILSVQMV
jgi:hypothetical protein